jgi:hypothetical protein
MRTLLWIALVRCIILLGPICLGSWSGRAQTRDLATTDDGGRLYFSSTSLSAGEAVFLN